MNALKSSVSQRKSPGTSSPTVMQLKCDEILSHARISDGLVSRINSSLAILRKAITSIPERRPISVSEAEVGVSWLKDVVIPFKTHRPAHDLNYKLVFEKPCRVDVTGSFSRNSISRAKSVLTIDLAIVVPAVVFQPKDYTKYRYFHKRAYYLACIAAGLLHGFTKYEGIEYAYQSENVLQPIIIITTSATKLGEKPAIQFRLLFSTEDTSLFTYEKLTKGLQDADLGFTGLPASRQAFSKSLYISTIISECIAPCLSQYLASIAKSSQAFVDACMLGSLWLRHRGFHGTLGQGGFGNFEWTCTTALLLATGQSGDVNVTSRGYTSLQIFKLVLHFLATSNFYDGGTLLPSNEAALNSKRSYVSGPFLFDNLHGLNILFKMTSGSCLSLRKCAIRTLEALQTPTIDHFKTTFTKNLDTDRLLYDYSFRFPFLPRNDHDPREILRFDHVSDRQEHVYSILRRGLGDRTKDICLKSHITNKWLLNESNTRSFEQGTISVGLSIDAAKAEVSIDKGPQAVNEKSASWFRKFWDEKAELRRFGDGEILEAVVWDRVAGENSVIEEIVQFLLEHKLATKLSSVEWSISPQDHLLQKNPLCGFSDQQLYSAFETVEHQLRQLRDLPLHIRQISFIEPEVLNISKNQALEDPSSTPCVCEAGINLQFEASSRWPDSIQGISRAKVALLLKLGGLLESEHSNMHTRLALDGEIEACAVEAVLRIQVASNIRFHLRIHTDREAMLMRKALEALSKSTTEREAAALLLARHKQQYVQAPLHTHLMRTMSTRFSCLSGCVSSMIRWRDSHMLTNHMNNALIELLVLRTFVHPMSFEAPGTVRVAFLRTLHLIAGWDWRSEPLIIDMVGEMTAAEIGEISTNFEAWRRLDPAMNKLAMFVATSADRTGTTWTQGNPSVVAATRLTGLAKAANAMILDQDSELNMRLLFEPNLDDYDFLIYTKTTNLDHGDAQRRFRNLASSHSCHPNEHVSTQRSFLTELQRMYDGIIVFFMGGSHVRVIGAIWHPDTTMIRSWKFRIGYSHKPVNDESSSDIRVKCNREAVLADIARLGEGLISTIRINP